MTEVLYGLDAAERERVAALRAQGGFYWLDVSLSETTLDDLREALGIPERALRALSSSGEVSSSRTLHADGQSVVFALRCYVEAETPAGKAAYRLRPLKVHCAGHRRLPVDASPGASLAAGGPRSRSAGRTE